MLPDAVLRRREDPRDLRHVLMVLRVVCCVILPLLAACSSGPDDSDPLQVGEVQQAAEFECTADSQCGTCQICSSVNGTCVQAPIGFICTDATGLNGHCDANSFCCTGSNCLDQTTFVCQAAGISLGCTGRDGALCGSTCDDRYECTVDTCDSLTKVGCSYSAAANGTQCAPFSRLGYQGTCYEGYCCMGCWDTRNGTCRAGVTETACGDNGTTCKSCFDGNECTSDVCSNGTSCSNPVLANGTACTGGECLNGNCCQGCISPDSAGDICLPGDDPNSCGSGAGLCQVCEDNNECTVNNCTGGACDFTPVLDGTQCAGGAGACFGGTCCTGCVNGNSCAPGDTSDACGSGGSECASCDDGNECTVDTCGASGCGHSNVANGQSCKSGAGTCYAGQCCEGCWTGSKCIGFVDQSAGSCGSGGSACAVCDDEDACSVNACVSGTCDFSVPAPVGTTCRTVAGNCDTAETCNGIDNFCPEDAFMASDVVCRDATGGDCDAPEFCTGSGPNCPSDSPLPNGTVCRPEAPGTTCDVAETCDGITYDCPADEYAESTVVCRSGSCSGDTAVVEATCPGATVSPECPPEQQVSCGGAGCTGDVCSGGCTVADDCTAGACAGGACYCAGGSCVPKGGLGDECGAGNQCLSNFCADGVCCDSGCTGTCEVCNDPSAVGSCTALPSGTVCRSAPLGCDVEETCDGTSGLCPLDVVRSNGFVCNAAVGDCDVAETCDGTNKACPPDDVAGAGTSCADDGEICTTDRCNGTDKTCQHAPGNSGVVCNPSAGECDVEEKCDGTTPTCPTDVFLSSDVTCRTAPLGCDVAEQCTGTGPDCPEDAYQAAGTACASDSNPCTKDECSGSAPNCTHPPGNAGAVCRAGSECDPEETCTGTSTTCPDDLFDANGTTCTDDGKTCTEDICNGLGDCVHPAGNAGTVCRSTEGNECDLAETCDGSSTQCPTDVSQPAGTACSDDGELCTVDECDGFGVCAHPAGNDGSICRPAAPTGCDEPEACTGSTPSCPADGFKADGTSCSDGDICNGLETCQTGACSAGTAPNCDDANPCTTDTCDPASGCQNTALSDGTSCDDGNDCNTGDQCTSGVCSGTGGPSCNDANPCTTDSCDPVDGSCINTPLSDGATCNDGSVCTQVDECSSGSCVGSSPLNCDDGNPCTNDSCDAALGCINTPVTDGTSCADQNLCDGTEVCSGGACVDGTPLNCNDSNPCTGDACVPATGCVNQPVGDGLSCSDGNACNGDETCQSGTCSAGTPLVCDDGDPCTTDSCDPSSGGCVSADVPDGTACPDGDVCNGQETCQSGACLPGAPLDCDDGDVCTADSCDAVMGCVADPVTDGTACDDGDVCTSGETCVGGACGSGFEVDCDDGNPCTDGSCDPDIGCTFAPVPDQTVCDDDNPCSDASECQSGECRATVGLDCNDSNPCTQDGCEVTDGGIETCVHTSRADGSACSDSDACTAGDACEAGVCVAGDALGCDDGNECTFDLCDPDVGCQTFALSDGIPCIDGDACTTGDACTGGVCTPSGTVTCAPLDECHVAGTCDPGSGTCTDPRAPDGTPCMSGTMQCQSGVCGGGGTGGAGGAGGAGATGGVGPGGSGGGPGGAGGLDAGGGMPAGMGGGGLGGGGAGGSGAVGGAGTAGTGATAPDGGVAIDGSIGGGDPMDPEDPRDPFVRDPQGCACRVGEQTGPRRHEAFLAALALGAALTGRRRRRDGPRSGRTSTEARGR